MTKQWHGGKGSQRRNSNNKAYADNYDKIFNKEKSNGNESSEISKEKSSKESKKEG